MCHAEPLRTVLVDKGNSTSVWMYFTRARCASTANEANLAGGGATGFGRLVLASLAAALKTSVSSAVLIS